MKRLKHIFPLFALMISLALGAQAQDRALTVVGTPGRTSLTVPASAKSLDFAREGGVKSFAIKTNTTVRPRTSASWATATLSGDSVKVSVSENSDNAVRSAVVTLGAPDGASVDIAVRQLGTDPAFFVSTDTIVTKGNGGGVVVSVIANAALTFSTPDWLSAKDASYASGEKNYVFTTSDMQVGTRYGNLGIAIAGSSQTATVVVEQVFEGYPSFIVMSDVHLGASGSQARVTKSLQTMYDNSGDVDAIIVNGDLTDNGNLDQYQQMTAIFNDYDIVPDGVARYFVMGNHEWYTNDGNGSMNNYNTLGVDHDKYFDIKGYPFIYIGMSGGGENDYSDASLAFLKQSLDDAVLRYPGKPIFVFTHIPGYGTVQGTGASDGGWGSTKITNVLNDYPMVMNFSGHTHLSERCPTTINQNTFTSLNDGGNKDIWTQTGIDDDGTHPDGALAEGMIVTVEDASNIAVRRIDGQRGEEIGETLNFPAPYDGTNFTYKDYKGSKPYFADDAEVRQEQVQPTQRRVTFSQASIQDDDPNNVVLYYRVEIVNANDEAVASGKRCSQFYYGSDMPAELSIVLSGLDAESQQELRAKVTAIDPFGNESDPVYSPTFRVGEYTPDPSATLPTADLLDLAVDDNGVGTDKSAAGTPLITGATSPIPFYDPDYKLSGAKFSQDGSQFYAIDLDANTNVANALQNEFTMEVFFTSYDVNGGGNDQAQTPMSAQEGGGSGFWMYNGGGMYFYAGNPAGGYYELAPTANLRNGEYSHMVATYDGSKLKLYLNGYPAGEMDAAGPLTLPISTGRYLVIGGDANTAGHAQATLNGVVLIARLYSRAITRDEDYLLYQDAIKNYEKQDSGEVEPAEEAPVADLFDVEFGENGTAKDVSANAIEIETGSTAPETYYNETYKRWSAKFPGDDGSCYFAVPYLENTAINDALANDFTIEALCQINNEGNLDNSLPAVLSSQQQGGIGIEVGSVVEAWAHFGGSYATVYANDYSVVKDTWYHIVVTVQYNDIEVPDMKIYVNGNYAGHVPLAGPYDEKSDQGTHKFFIGGDVGPGGAWSEYLLKGEVAVAKMYGKTLSPSEVKRLYVDLTK